MKYRVNLFPEELKPKLELFTLSFVAVMWAVSLGALFAVSHHYQERYDDLQTRTKDTQAEHRNRKATLQTFIAARDKRAQDQSLVNRVDKLTGESRDKQLLLDELKGREQLKNQGFSTLMLDLSERHINGMWLTRININEQKVRIEGGAQDSAMVPSWVSQLRDSEYFTGRNFAGARMFRDDEDLLNFVISSDLVELTLEAETGIAP